MIRIMQLNAPQIAAFWSATMLLAAALLVLPAHAEQRAEIVHLSVMVDTLPHDFSAKAQQAGLNIIEVEVLHALESNIVHIQPTNTQSLEVAFKILKTSFPATAFERLDDQDGAFELVDF